MSLSDFRERYEHSLTSLHSGNDVYLPSAVISVSQKVFLDAYGSSDRYTVEFHSTKASDRDSAFRPYSSTDARKKPIE